MYNGGAISELCIAKLFLESNWQVFLPIIQEGQVDMVVRQRHEGRYYRLEVKHSEPGQKNPGYLDLRKRKQWDFDVLVFHLPELSQVVILPRSKVRKSMRLCNKATRKILPVFDRYACEEKDVVKKLVQVLHG